MSSRKAAGLVDGTGSGLKGACGMVRPLVTLKCARSGPLSGSTFQSRRAAWRVSNTLSTSSCDRTTGTEPAADEELPATAGAEDAEDDDGAAVFEALEADGAGTPNDCKSSADMKSARNGYFTSNSACSGLNVGAAVARGLRAEDCCTSTSLPLAKADCPFQERQLQTRTLCTAPPDGELLAQRGPDGNELTERTIWQQQHC